MAFIGAIKVDPPTCPITAAGGVSKHTITNMSDVRLAFKVRSSNNSNYSVSKVTGFLDPKQQASLTITRQGINKIANILHLINGPPKQDKLVFQYAFAEPDVADAATVFANGLPPIELAGETHMKLSAAE